MNFRSMHFTRLLLAVSLSAILPMLLGGCGRGTVRPAAFAPGFSLASLSSAPSVLVVSEDVRVTEFKKSFSNAFGTGEILAAYISARVLDSLNGSIPKIATTPAASGLARLFAEHPNDSLLAYVSTDSGAFATPAYVLRIRNVTVGNAFSEIPRVVLPTAAPNSMAPEGGGTNESCIVTFDVEIWEFRGGGNDGGRELARRGTFGVTGRADVVVYAYKSALVEAVRAATRVTARHLRGQ
jgi:hypothetical protein